MPGFDAIVVGAGHNGLAAAIRLAKAGRRVTVLESREVCGGLAAGSEFHPGYRTRGFLLDTGSLRRSVIAELELERHGLLVLPGESGVYLPATKGKGLMLFRDPERTVEENPDLSPEDGRNYRRFREFIGRITGLGRGILDAAPPPISDRGFEGLWTLARTGLSLRTLGDDDMLELLRIAPMCAADWLGEWFENDLLKAGLAQPAIHGTFMGPWSAGSTATLLLGEIANEIPGIKGGPQALASALVSAAEAAGVVIRTASPVERIRLADGAVHGVALRGGENIDAPVVLSSADPARTFLDLIDPADLPLSVYEQVRLIRARGTTAKVNLALSGPLEFAGRPEAPVSAARTGETLDQLEKAFDAVKYRERSEVPVLDIRVPTVTDGSLAPSGHHVAEILVHFAPHDLNGGWNEQERLKLGEAVIGVLAGYCPTLKNRIVATEVLTPADLSERYGLTGGHIHHAEHALDQLYAMRPNAEFARYATPIRGLYLGGSGSHPGGGITAMPGTLAAKAVLAN